MGDDADVLLAGHYFLAVEGVAMMRRFLDDPASLARRAAEVEKIVEGMGEFPQKLRIPVSRHDVMQGYQRWAPRYDGPNPAIELEEPVFAELLQAVPPGVALDAACGTGRHALRLAEAGHQVIGVDANPAMLDVARGKLPATDLRVGELTALPLEDASVDLVCCGLALTHVERLDPVLAEFARVLRPGGQVILSDMHPRVTSNGGHAVFPTDDAGMTIHYVPNLLHEISDYIQAFRAAGLTVLDCREPLVTDAVLRIMPSYPVLPEATAEAVLGMPYLLLWRLGKPGG